MTIDQTPLSGLLVITPDVFADDRGFFLESYHADKFATMGITDTFVQDNHSYSGQNVIRGLHYQKAPHQQSKLVRVVSGEVFDVAVDLRADSPTYGQWHGEMLSGANHKMLYVPIGFAHGFCVLSEGAHFVYKCGALYDPTADAGIRYDDPTINITWPIDITQAIVSQKDQALPNL